MRIPKPFLALPLLAVAALASAQTSAPAAYSDATNAGEAIQALSGSEIASDAMLQACSQRFPGMQSKWQSELDAWRQREAPVLAKVDGYVALARKFAAAEQADTERNVRLGVESRFSVLEKANLPQAQTREAESELCSEHFSALASGAWRQRTPNVYALIERARPAPSPDSPEAIAHFAAAAKAAPPPGAERPPIVAGKPSVQMSYQDADNASQAVGQMMGNVIGAPLMAQACEKRYPDQQQDIDAELATWRTNDAREIAVAQEVWNRLLKTQAATLQQMRTAIESVPGQTFQKLDAMDPDGSRHLAAEYCRQHFVEFASGVWRVRTPKAYGYLDELARSMPATRAAH